MEIRAAEKPTSTCTLWALMLPVPNATYNRASLASVTNARWQFKMTLLSFETSINFYKQIQGIEESAMWSVGFQGSIKQLSLESDENLHCLWNLKWVKQTITGHKPQLNELRCCSWTQVSQFYEWHHWMFFHSGQGAMHMTSPTTSVLGWPGPIEGWADSKVLQHFKTYIVQLSISAWH